MIYRVYKICLEFYFYPTRKLCLKKLENVFCHVQISDKNYPLRCSEVDNFYDCMNTLGKLKTN